MQHRTGRYRAGLAEVRDARTPRRAVLLRPMALAAAMLWCGSGKAHAQFIEQYFPEDIPGYEPDLSASVISRMEAEGEGASEGVQLGDFVIRPQLNESAGYDSNTLGRAGSGSSEIQTNASLNGDSDWSRNAVSFSLNVDNQLYPEETLANQTNWSAGASGRLDLGHADSATFAYLHQSLDLAATSIGEISVVTPVPFNVDDVKASYLRLSGRISLTFSGEFENIGFGDGGVGDAANYSSLTHSVELARVTEEYEEAPGDAFVLIMQPSFAQFPYHFANNYTDISGFGGIEARGDRIVQYRVLVGVEHRSFSSNATATATTPTFELNATWTPTELDTVSVTGVHRLDDPVSPFAVDEDLLDGRVELDHELRENVFLTGYAEASRTVSPSATAGAGSLSQAVYNAGVSAVWNFSRHLSATLSYGFSDIGATSGGAEKFPGPTFEGGRFASAVNGRGFNVNNIMIGIQLYE